MKSQDEKHASGKARYPDGDERKQWQNPKLQFIEPRLRKRGNVKEVTGQGFFGAFSP